MNRLIILLASVFLYSYAHAQQEWTLEQCINYAIDNNIQIQQSALDIKINENNILDAKLDVLPSINANTSPRFSFGRSLDYSTYQYVDENNSQIDFSLNGRMPLFRGLQNYNTIQQNQYRLFSSQEALAELKNDISVMVALAYLKILFFTEELQNARDQLELSKQQLERTKQLVNVGNLAKGELLEIQAQVAREELSEVETQNSVNLAYLELTQLLNIDSVNAISIIIPEIAINENEQFLYNVNSVYNEAESIMPQIKRADYDVKVSEEDVQIAKGAYYPELWLGSSYGSFYSQNAKKILGINPVDTSFIYADKYPFNEQFSDQSYTSVYFSLSIPIFNRYDKKTRVENSKIRYLQAQNQLKESKQKLYKDIQQAYTEANNALQKYKATQKAFLAMNESYDYAQQKFEVGLVNSFDLNKTKTERAKTESEMVAAKFEYVLRKQILEFYRGNAISMSNYQ